MASSENIGHLTMSMRTCYGSLWKHDTQEAMQVWANALARYDGQQINEALATCMGYFKDFPPTLPQFLEVIRESVPLLTGSAEADAAMADKVFAYSKPQGQRNPSGNPFGITLPDSISRRRQGESIDEYRRRISAAVTIEKYPDLMPIGD